MSLEKALEFLGKVEGSADHVEAIKKELSVVRGEAAKHRTIANAATEKATKYDALTKTLIDSEIDLDGDLTAQFSELKAAKGKAGAADEMTRKLSAIEKKLAEAEKKTVEAETRAQKKAVEATFGKVLSDTFHGGEFMLKSLAADGVIGMNGDAPYVAVDGARVDLSAGIEALKKTYAASVRNAQSGGSGQPQNTNAATGKKRSEMTTEERTKAITNMGQEAYLALPE